MKGFTILFIVLREYENLGTGYLSSALAKDGFRCRILDFRIGKKKILSLVKKIKPSIIGFSVVYQYNIDKFIDLAGYLRDNGICCHFTAGGHYATVKYEELLDFFPSIDSVIRGEGEHTMLELARALFSGTEWQNIMNIVTRGKNGLIINPLRNLEDNLDSLPLPKRAPLKKYVFDLKYSTLIASRGCIYDCSFCNLKEFYLPYKKSSKRYRSPESVVDEMNYLYKKRNCKVFLFQDDDFPVFQKNNNDWIIRFCECLIDKNLSDKIIWKINCRPDEIDPQLFYYLKALGLFLVFLGIEDGTDEGLKRLNKHISARTILESVKTLKNLKIGLDYGFLLFQPSTGFSSLRENIDFLAKICGDGYSAVTFLKLMPYYETPDERQLIVQGRIKGPAGYKDYDFNTKTMDNYFNFVTGCTIDWIRNPAGLVNTSKWIRNFFLVHDHFYSYKRDLSKIHDEFTALMRNSNKYLLDSLSELSVEFEKDGSKITNHTYLDEIRRDFYNKHQEYTSKMGEILAQLKIISLAYSCSMY